MTQWRPTSYSAVMMALIVALVALAQGAVEADPAGLPSFRLGEAATGGLGQMAALPRN